MAYGVLKFLLMTCLGGVISCAGAKESEMPKSFKIMMDGQAFSITMPVPPDNEFVKYRSSLSLHDQTLFEKSNSVIALQVHWTYRAGLMRKVAGVMELTVMLQAALEHNVMIDEGLKQALLADFKRELRKVGYTGGAVRFQTAMVNGRSWQSYKVPVLELTEYSTGVTDTRLLTVRFAFIDNTGEPSPAWYQDAQGLMKQLIDSVRIEP